MHERRKRNMNWTNQLPKYRRKSILVCEEQVSCEGCRWTLLPGGVRRRPAPGAADPRWVASRRAGGHGAAATSLHSVVSHFGILFFFFFYNFVVFRESESKRPFHTGDSALVFDGWQAMAGVGTLEEAYAAPWLSLAEYSNNNNNCICVILWAKPSNEWDRIYVHGPHALDRLYASSWYWERSRSVVGGVCMGGAVGESVREECGKTSVLWFRTLVNHAWWYCMIFIVYVHHIPKDSGIFSVKEVLRHCRVSSHAYFTIHHFPHPPSLSLLHSTKCLLVEVGCSVINYKILISIWHY